jgi:hypothetical protein
MQRIKNLIGYTLLALSFMVCFSCEKETLTDEPASTEPISFSTDIKPIFSSCTGCHNSSLSPNLNDQPYQALIDGSFINKSNPSQSKLYLQLTTKSTHISKVSSANKNIILQWITQGALNN